MLSSYLANRIQYVEFNSAQSETLPIANGVPQGSILGPLFFLIYINDLPKSEINDEITLFADDTVLFGNLDNSSVNTFDQVKSWLTENQLKLNETKTKTVIFHPNQLGFTDVVSHSKISDKAKYLGVILDNKLNFKEHITSVKLKCAKNISVFYQLRKFMSRPFLLRAYCTYVQPIYQYGVLIYGTANKTSLMQLEKQQKYLLRIIFGLRKHQSTSDIRNKFKIPLVRELHLYELLKLLSKILRREHVDSNVNNYITEDEIASFFDPSIRTKLLKTKCLINNKTHKQINVRIRQLFNIFVKFDPNVITKMVNANDRELNHLLHNLRDVFICDNTELISKFW